MSDSQWRVRPKVLIQGAAIVLPLTVLITAAVCLAYHPVRVWLANGNWCAHYRPDGTGTILYGDECDR